MKHTYEGAAAGRGAIYTWAGNSEVGEGRMTLVESRPSDAMIGGDFDKGLVAMKSVVEAAPRR